jgi:hypothetical protein
MVREIKKIYVDSRFRNHSSPSSTDFRIHLNESIHVPDHTSVIVTDICIPHTWYTIEYFNENLYFRHFRPDGTYQDYIAQLPKRNYDINSLASAVALAMNQALGTVNAFLANANITTGIINVQLTLSAGDFFNIYSDRTLRTKVAGTWNGNNYDANNPMSCNSILGHDDIDESPTQKGNIWQSGFVDVLSIHSVYITSPNFGNTSMGPRGERNILKKLVTSAGFGQLITDVYVNTDDVNVCSKKLFHTLEFRITDVNGNPLVLNGGHVSFTLLFVST